MNNVYIVLPVIIHMITAILCLLSWYSVNIQKVLSVIGNTAGLIVSIFLLKEVYTGPILTMQGGGWAAPFGITFVADTFSLLLVSLTCISSLAFTLYSFVAVNEEAIRKLK